MPLKVILFPLDNLLTDRENVLNFIDQLPSILEQFFDKNACNFFNQLDKDKKLGINQVLFLAAFNEAKGNLVEEVRIFKQNLINNPIAINETDNKLVQIGFANNSLKLKSALLNKLWKQLRDHLESINTSIIDFKNRKIKKFVKKSLDYLNSILGSLLALIPGVDGIKEIKEFIHIYLE